MNGQRHAYQATINDPIPKGWDHHRIKEELITGFPTLKYFCMSDEIGDKGTYHTGDPAVLFSARMPHGPSRCHLPKRSFIWTGMYISPMGLRFTQPVITV